VNGTLSFLGDVFSYGLTWCYVLGLVPALFITVTKDLWTMFFAGLLSFGLAWFFGAISWAKPDSGGQTSSTLTALNPAHPSYANS